MKIHEKGNPELKRKGNFGKLINGICFSCGCKFDCCESETIVTEEKEPVYEDYYDNGHYEVVGYRTKYTYWFRCPNCKKQLHNVIIFGEVVKHY